MLAERTQRRTKNSAEAGEDELDILIAGFMTIRDQEPLDDVANWANAVLALLKDERV